MCLFVFPRKCGHRLKNDNVRLFPQTNSGVGEFGSLVQHLEIFAVNPARLQSTVSFARWWRKLLLLELYHGQVSL